MPSGGSVCAYAVFAGMHSADGGPCPPTGRSTRTDYVYVTVADDGPGMDEEVRLRAMEPFFTTKDVGHGSGLGLSQVFGFASQSGGFAFIDSQPGRGTRVTLALPIPDPAP